MWAVDARDLWLAELRTGGASPYTIRNYLAATDEAFRLIGVNRATMAKDLPLDGLTRDDVVVALSGYLTYQDRRGRTRTRAQSTADSCAQSLEYQLIRTE
jgi:hypothetical protein